MSPSNTKPSLALATEYTTGNTEPTKRRRTSDSSAAARKLAGKTRVFIDLTGSPTKPTPVDCPIEKYQPPTEEKTSQPSVQERPHPNPSPAHQLKKAPRDVDTPVRQKKCRPPFPSVKAHSSSAAITGTAASDHKAKPELIPGEIDEILAAYVEKPRVKIKEEVGRVYIFDIIYRPRGMYVVKIGESLRPTASRSQELRGGCDLYVEDRSPDTVFKEVPFYHRVLEKLVQLELAGSRFSFPRPCPCGTKKHSEFFVVDREVAVKAVHRWTKFCLQNPYKLTRIGGEEKKPKFEATLKPEWRRKLLRRPMATAEESINSHHTRGARWDCFVQPPDPFEEWREELSISVSKAANHMWQLWSTILAFWLCFCSFGKFNVLLAFGTLIGFLFHLGDSSVISRLVSKNLVPSPWVGEELAKLDSTLDHDSAPSTPREEDSSRMDIESPLDGDPDDEKGVKDVDDGNKEEFKVDGERSNSESTLPPLPGIGKSTESDEDDMLQDGDSGLGSSP